MPQIGRASRKHLPQSNFLLLYLGRTEGPALALPQLDGYEPCPGRF